MTTLWQDIRYGLRVMRKRPGFTAVAVVTLALGIGANTAIFSVVNAVLLRPLPHPEPDRLVALTETSKEVPVTAVSYPNYVDWRAQQTVFEEISARMPNGGVLTGAGAEPERITGRWVSASFFRVLGVRPAAGRFFGEDEDRSGGPAVMVISHGLWQRRFGGDPSVVGGPVTYNGESWMVVGVMPAGFDFYGAANANNDFFTPLGLLGDQEFMRDRHSHTMQVTARLKRGVTLAEARAEMDAIAARLAAEHPASNAGNGIRVRGLLDDYVGEVRPALLLVSTAVALVLLVACANVANLLLARSTGRRREVAVRMALGAGRWRVVRQLLTESVMLALAGGIAGLLLAVWGTDLLVRLNEDALPRFEEVSIDPRVLGFTMLVSLVTGAVFGLAPALQTSRVDFNDALKEGGRESAGGRGGRRLRSCLIVTEVALSLVLLAGAGLLVKSFRRLSEDDPGYEARGVLTLRLRLPDAKYREAPQSMSFLREVTRRVEGLPGVEYVSVATGFPLGRGSDNGYWVEGDPEPQRPGDWPTAVAQAVSEDYFDALSIGLVAGRVFDARDTADSPPVVVVDQHFVRRHFPDGGAEGALGKRLRFGGEGEPWQEVVGVVRHVRHETLAEEGRPGVYRPWTQIRSRWVAGYMRAMDVVVKTSGDPAGLVAPIKREVQAVDPDQPLANVRTLESLVDESVAPRRFALLLVGLFALIALLLGAVGLYGVMSYAVTRRTREIGIRIALGAQRRDVLGLVIREGMALSLIGVGVGLGAALALTPLMRGLLYGVTAADPGTFALVALLLAAVALLASYLPARRAARVDPMEALRHE